MQYAHIIPADRRFFVYAFPDVADENGNLEITLDTNATFYATSISSVFSTTFFLYNLSAEKMTIPTEISTITGAIQTPIISGNGGTPYFFPVPWALSAGTLLRLVPINIDGQISVAGYHQ